MNQEKRNPLEEIQQIVETSHRMWIGSSMKYWNKEKKLTFGSTYWSNVDEIQLVNISVVNVAPEYVFIPTGHSKKVTRVGGAVQIEEVG